MNEENGKRQRKKSINISVVLSLVVAVFAIAALVTVGFNQISFASPLDPSTGEFTSASETVHIYGNGGGNYNVPMYFDSTGNTQVFCINKGKDFAGSTTYRRQNEITDYGLLYILANTLVSDKYVTNVTDNNKVYAETWVAQTAIWMYLDGHREIYSDQLTDAEIAEIKSTTSLSVQIPSENVDITVDPGVNLYTSYVAPLVSEAEKRHTDGFAEYVLVNKADENISKVDDGKYYQTSAITITAKSTDDLLSYRVSTAGVEGAFVVGEDGKTIAEDQDISPETKIFVRIPADKIKDVSKNLILNVDAKFRMFAGYVYAASENDQEVVTVEDQEAHILGGTVFEVVGTPDTGMNTAQTIYFIGLVVLLCGVGIIYANAKPVKKHSQQ